MTNTTVKMTQRDFFNELIALATANDRADLVEFCEGRIEQLDKKKSGTKSKKNEENVALAEIAFDALVALGGSATVSEVMKQASEFEDFSNQKVSALMKMLVTDGRVERDTTGKKTIFRVVEA